MTDRKPDYVFNVWRDLYPKPVLAITDGHAPASWHLEHNKLAAKAGGTARITHRIRVFMKDKRS